ncbi:dynein axonemal intermediate chain 4 [Melozone crissalis]|uniref:dynein axonemal intermediate chain 4 n=1 Tax=Melozone crissalis TaxID=40204 RepID=UPI0023DB0C9A|nr:dynein axonemal intermediate chain 4 [Melozone crissalis]
MVGLGKVGRAPNPRAGRISETLEWLGWERWGEPQIHVQERSQKPWNGWVGKGGESPKSTCRNDLRNPGMVGLGKVGRTKKPWNGWVGHPWEEPQIHLWEEPKSPGMVGLRKVFDEEGKNVTPQPLFQPDPNAARQEKTHGSSLWTSPQDTSPPKPGLDEAEPEEDADLSLSGKEHPQQLDAALTEAELEQVVEVLLTETDTRWMLDLPTALVSTEAEEAPRVLERNKIYTELCEAKIDSEYFEEKIAQTFSGAAKTKEVQCETITVAEKGVVVTPWDLDHPLDASGAEPAETEGPKTPAGTSSTSLTAGEQGRPGAVPSATDSAAPARSPEEQECHSGAILTSAKLQQDLVVMERILMENIFQPKLAVYRQIPVLIEPVVTSDTEVEEDEEEEEDEDEDEEEAAEAAEGPAEEAGPRLELLWSFRCDLTRGHSVSSMSWNKANPDLLAVGYREFVSRGKKKGLACCWSLKNPMWPERIFRCEHGVTAVDFSRARPHLLAVGTASGRVAVYDVRSRQDTALLDSSASLNKHKGPVWQLKWVEQEGGATAGDKEERLMCISGDGRMTQWFIQQRLDCSDVMQIKRTESEKKKLPGERERKSEGPISQQAAGMCFDFHPKDTDIFLAGTEEGHIYCCSCSGKEQILGTYRGHEGPVYKVAWNPTSTDMFLSCSADWSILLWHRDSHTPLLTFTSVTAVVHDIKWSPHSALIFAAVNEQRVEIWDLSVSIFDPVLCCAGSPEGTLSSLLFARNAECLLLGDSRGQVGVWLLPSLAVPSSEQVGSLYDIVAPAGAVKQ